MTPLHKDYLDHYLQRSVLVWTWSRVPEIYLSLEDLEIATTQRSLNLIRKLREVI